MRISFDYDLSTLKPVLDFFSDQTERGILRLQNLDSGGLPFQQYCVTVFMKTPTDTNDVNNWAYVDNINNEVLKAYNSLGEITHADISFAGTQRTEVLMTINTQHPLKMIKINCDAFTNPSVIKPDIKLMGCAVFIRSTDYNNESLTPGYDPTYNGIKYTNLIQYDDNEFFFGDSFGELKTISLFVDPVSKKLNLRKSAAVNYLKPRIYPPAPFTYNESTNDTVKTQTFSGQAYGNGVYRLSIRACLHFSAAFDVDSFMDEGENLDSDKSKAGWHSPEYDTRDNWLVIMCPVLIEPTHYILVNRDSTSLSDEISTQMPRDWLFQGCVNYNIYSGNGSWETIDTVNNAAFRNSQHIQYNVNTHGKKYTSFRWFFIRARNTQYMVIREILIYGNEFDASTGVVPVARIRATSGSYSEYDFFYIETSSIGRFVYHAGMRNGESAPNSLFGVSYDPKGRKWYDIGSFSPYSWGDSSTGVEQSFPTAANLETQYFFKSDGNLAMSFTDPYYVA
jgi:hypothetical protein